MSSSIPKRLRRLSAIGLVVTGVGFSLATTSGGAQASGSTQGGCNLYLSEAGTIEVANGTITRGGRNPDDHSMLFQPGGSFNATDTYICKDGKWVPYYPSILPGLRDVSPNLEQNPVKDLTPRNREKPMQLVAI